MSSLGEMLKKNNGNFMVSIHGVPVNVLLIISVVYLIFRFKRGIVCCPFRILRLWKLPNPVEQTTPEPTPI